MSTSGVYRLGFVLTCYIYVLFTCYCNFNVYFWNLQAEIAMREAGKPGMSDEEVRC